MGDTPAFDLNDETQLLFAFVTDGCGYLIMLNSMQEEVARRRLVTDHPNVLRAAMKSMITDVET